jgi:hypothetical protein
MKQTIQIIFRSLSHRLALLLAVLICAGCGDGNSLKLSSDESKAFASAPAELKQQWEKLLAADQAKDYGTVQKLLEALASQTLNENQKLVLEKERANFGERLWAAAEKNDPAAIKAVQDFNKSRNQKRAR